ncbi:MAG: BamA/TamA family outer membrane protein [Bacteroidota bacterium]
MSGRPWWFSLGPWLVAAWLVGLFTGPAQAQAPLYLVNEETTVRGISFRFVDTRSFQPEVLEEQMATLAPPAFASLRRRLRWIPLPFFDVPAYPFSPVELQRDVARLRQFYARNGYLDADITYAPSQLDTSSNTIRILFAVREGPPLIIQDVGFFAPDGAYAASLFDEPLRASWTRFRRRVTLRTGERLTEADRLRIRDEMVAWLRDRGFAFATVRSEADVDQAQNTADLRYVVDPGPRATIERISIEGNTSVNERVVRRELPFKTGDRFSGRDLSVGQRELLQLNLFRVALAEVPEQPMDSTVDVRIRLSEGQLRSLGAETGYANLEGLRLVGQWNHRNFAGGARNFSVILTANTGLLAFGDDSDQFLTRLFRSEVSLRQPYVFTSKLGVVVAPFAQTSLNPLFEDNPDDPTGLGLNASEYGVTTRLITEVLPFRSVTFQHLFSRVQVTTLREDTSGIVVDGEVNRDPFNRSIFSLSANLGRVDDFFQPTQGVLVRPLVEAAGGVLGSGVEYYKVRTEAIGYLPLTPRINLSARLVGGRLWPIRTSRDQTDLSVENRFDDIRFYAGGSNDIRGYNLRSIGPLQGRFLPSNDGCEAESGSEPTLDTDCWNVEPVGGLGKVAANVEVRLPFPGLDAVWGTAVFVDAGTVWEDQLDLPDLRVGVGGGIRYETPVGFVRLDVGYKLNATRAERLGASEQAVVERFFAQEGLLSADDLDPRFFRRFNLHFSIGQAF